MGETKVSPIRLMLDHDKIIAESRQRWDISTTDNPSVLYEQFRSQFLQSWANIDGKITDREIRKYCRINRITETWVKSRSPYDDAIYSKSIIKQLDNTRSINELFHQIEIVLSLRFKYSPDRKLCAHDLKELMHYSGLPYELVEIDDVYIIKKKGEPILDKEVVNRVLQIISGLPHEHFLRALQDFSVPDKDNYLDVVTELRRSFEEFVKQETSTGIRLSNKNINEFNKWLKDNTKIKPNLVNTITENLKQLNHYFDDNEKHETTLVAENEAEYLIYEIANIMRTILLNRN